MRVVIDIETNSLVNPVNIWLIVCKDIDTGDLHIFREVTKNDDAKQAFMDFAEGVQLWIGHNILDFDLPVIDRLLACNLTALTNCGGCRDTLLISRMVDYSREQGHSIEAYGLEFGLEKIKFSDYTKYSKELEQYCIRDVEIAHKVYLKYLRYLKLYNPSVLMEHKFHLVVNNLRDNGFRFNTTKAKDLLKKVEHSLSILDKDILEAFPPKLKLIREINPKVTKHGTLSRTDFRWLATKDGELDLSDFNGGPFCRCAWVEFNPSSHKQIIDVLHNAGWSPVDKTKTHLETERELNRKKYIVKAIDLQEQYAKLEDLKKYGWKINEANLATLPPKAPAPARSLAKRILLESRRRTLTEWLGLVQPDERIHGKFLGIGTWTHRMATQQPNMQNIPNDLDTNGGVKLLGKELRSLWQAPRNRLLAGVDAEGIQLRIFAHYIDDKEFTDALVNGVKAKKTDPHSLNQKVLGSVCKTRQAAKRFVYALLLGAGTSKLSEILECNDEETLSALDRLLRRYSGFASLKRDVIPSDAKRGYFIGLDGRKVQIPGHTVGERKHLCMSGYLQNGEAVVMKMATLNWFDKLKAEGIDFKLVNMVHDEWQTETVNNMETAIRLAEIQSRSLREVGEELKLKCPLAGSYWNDDHKDYTIGTNWYQTH